jgi:hypothetical protein
MLTSALGPVGGLLGGLFSVGYAGPSREGLMRSCWVVNMRDTRGFRCTERMAKLTPGGPSTGEPLEALVTALSCGGRLAFCGSVSVYLKCE